MADTIELARQTLSGPEAVTRTARATLRRHAAAPLTGTLPFWERLVQEVLAVRAGLVVETGPGPVAEVVAERAAPAFSGSPVTNSPALWRGIVATVLAEHDASSGLGERIPSFLSVHSPSAAVCGTVSAR